MFISKKKSLGIALALMFGLQAVSVSLPAVTYAAYAVEDTEVRNNTKDMLKELNEVKGETGNKGIHGDTTSIDKTTKSILDYVIKIWRQGEQEARSFEDSEGSNGKDADGNVVDAEANKQNSLVSVDNLRSVSTNLLSSVLSGDFKNVLIPTVDKSLEPLKMKDTWLSKNLGKILGSVRNVANSRNPWKAFQGEVQNQLTTELEKVMKSTKHPDVFPELDHTEIDDILAGGKTGKKVVDKFWTDKFPSIVTGIANKDPYAIRQAESEAIGAIYNNISKSRKQTTEARLVLMDKMEESRKRTEALLKTLPHVQGQKQTNQLMMNVMIEQLLMETYKAQADINHQQQESMEAEARDMREQNVRAADDAVLAAPYSKSYLSSITSGQ